MKAKRVRATLIFQNVLKICKAACSPFLSLFLALSQGLHTGCRPNRVATRILPPGHWVESHKPLKSIMEGGSATIDLTRPWINLCRIVFPFSLGMFLWLLQECLLPMQIVLAEERTLLLAEADLDSPVNNSIDAICFPSVGLSMPHSH